MNLPLTPIRFLLWAANEYGSKVGVVDGDRRLTYSELLQRSNRLAAALGALGVKPGDRVASLSLNCHQLLEAYYGVPIARAILLSLNVRLSAEEQAYILEHSGTKLVLFDPELLPLVVGLHAKLPGVRWISLTSREKLPDWVYQETYEQLIASAEPQPPDFTTYDENAVAELFYTSGSTGQPKGVMLSHRTLYLHGLNTALGTIRRGGRSAADRGVEMHSIPLFHANGWGRPHTVTFMGARHIMLKRFDPAAVCELIEREEVTAFSMVPTMANMLLSFPELARYDLSALEEVMIGGSPSSPELTRQLEERLGCRVLAGYGLTETSPVATMAHLKETLGEVSDHERIRRQAMTGYALPGVQVKVVGPDGAEVSKDSKTIGEILIRGDVVMDGYWSEPQATAEAVVDNWLHTGDMAWWDEHNYVLIVDRKKDIIISGGENISSVEVENIIASHRAVYEAAVVGVPDENWGEVVKAFVVVKAGSTATEDDIQEHVREHLAGFKVPKSVEFRDELPKGATGKILKRVLREPYWKNTGRGVHGGGSG